MAAGAPLPVWAERIKRERLTRGWSQRDAVRLLRAHGGSSVPGEDAVLRRWKAWEAAANEPDEMYRGLLAETFGTVAAALFPTTRPTLPDVAAPSMDTLEILARIRASDLDAATLEALSITVERLCSEYPYLPAEQLLSDGREWLTRVVDLRNRRLTLAQHREVLTLAGWLALLVGCVEYDSGDQHAAEATRRAALSLGVEADHPDIQGWAHEMRAWFALTAGDYRGVIVAAKAGAEVAGQRSVSVQLAAQEAKAWARMGDRRQVETALDRGRGILEGLPYPDNVSNHFVVDPAKYDFYGMEIYRVAGEDALAAGLAEEVLRASTDATGAERAPMRCTEARITLGIVAARSGDLEGAVTYGSRSLRAERVSIPHTLMNSRDLVATLNDRFPSEHATREYLDSVRALSSQRSDAS